MIGSCSSSNSIIILHRIVCSEHTSIEPITASKEVNPRDVLNVLERDFKDVDETNGLSKEDRRFYDITATRRQVADGRYEVPMSFKENLPTLECNIDLAEKRLEYLRRKFERDSSYKKEYGMVMDHVIDLNFCDQLAEDRISSRPAQYIPHHCIYH